MSREAMPSANSGGTENLEADQVTNPEVVETDEPAVEGAVAEGIEVAAESGSESPESQAAEVAPEVPVEPEGEKSPEEVWEGALGQEAEGTAEVEKSPDERLGDIDNRLSANDSSIKSLQEAIEAERQRINELRGQLGGDGEAGQETVAMKAKQDKLDGLMEEQEQIKQEKEETEIEKELGDVFAIFVQMNEKGDKEGLKQIAEKGVDKEGKPFKTKDGKEVSPDAAKKMAEAALKGIKNLTAFIVKAMISVVKGIFQGIKEGVAG